MEDITDKNKMAAPEAIEALMELAPSFEKEETIQWLDGFFSSSKASLGVQALFCVDPGFSHRDVIMNVRDPYGGLSFSKKVQFCHGPAMASIKKIMAYVSQNIPYIQDRRFSSTRIHPLFSFKDIQAALIFSILFRDYREEGPLLIDLGPERLRIVFSVKSMNSQTPLYTQESPNEDIAMLFRHFGLIDQNWLATMKRIMATSVIESLSEGTEIFDFVTTRRENGRSFESLKEMQKGILKYLAIKKEATRQEVQDYFSLNKRTASYCLLNLERSGFLEKTERAKSRFVRYRLKDGISDLL